MGKKRISESFEKNNVCPLYIVLNPLPSCLPHKGPLGRRAEYVFEEGMEANAVETATGTEHDAFFIIS